MRKINERLTGTARKVLAGAALAAGGFAVGAALFCALPAAASDNGSAQAALTEAAGFVGQRYRDEGDNSGGANVTRVAGSTCTGYTDADGDGVCDVYGNGVCDARGTGCRARGHHHGTGQGANSGAHHGAGHHGRS